MERSWQLRVALGENLGIMPRCTSTRKIAIDFARIKALHRFHQTYWEIRLCERVKNERISLSEIISLFSPNVNGGKTRRMIRRKRDHNVFNSRARIIFHV